MGHSVINPGMDNTTTRVYWNDRQPIREDIIRFFDGSIKLDWDRALRKSINSGSKISVNGSGHLVFSEEERESRRKQGKKCIYKEQELEQMFGE